MANYRQIHTQIWRDNWFLDLEPDEKLLFIYLFSNDNSNLAGLYELHERIVALETGLDIKRINEIVSKLEGDGKIFYRDGVVWIVNMQKYHSNAGEKVRRSIGIIIDGIPDCEVKQKYCIYNGIEAENTLSEKKDTLSEKKDTLSEKKDTLSKIKNTLSYSKSNSKSNSNTKSIEQAEEKVFSAAGSENSEMGKIATLYEAEIGLITSSIRDELALAVEEYPPDWIVEALHESARQNKRSWKYTEAILKRWKVDGFKTNNKAGNNGHKTSQPSGADVNLWRELAREQGVG
jgi:DnaD/phage-associated family protein